MEKIPTIIDYLQRGAAAFPHKQAFGYLEDGREIGPACTYASLLASVTTLADYFRASGLAGHPALLLYPEGLDFIIAFLACQQAAVIAVPMFLPRSSRHMARLGHIIADAQTRVVLTTASLIEKVQTGLKDYPAAAQLHILPTDNVTGPAARAARPLLAPLGQRTTSFIQYTSGSTGSPKGVVISHANLLHNQALLTATFGGDATSIIFSWLPFYHDMGLIGNILHAIYLGATCLLMSPLHFMQQPMRWLQAIARYRITHSGGPNFSYDLCVDSATEADMTGLDLSCWRVAYNGAEPVKQATMQRFAAHFAAAGFRQDAFFPCYGLAEATLLVAGVKETTAPFSVLADRAALNQGRVLLLAEEAAYAGTHLVASGKIPDGMEVRILAPPTTGEDTATIGEIMIAGASVSTGYWPVLEPQAPAATYLATGDLGFLWKGYLFVTGRKKEMLIIRGKNYYPYDIETACAAAHPAVQRNAVAAIAVTVGEQEHFVLLVEVKRASIRTLDATLVSKILTNRLIDSVGLAPFDIVLLSPLSIPRTSSGKLQRAACQRLYQDGFFDSKRLAGNILPEPLEQEQPLAPLLAQVRATGEASLILQYLQELFRQRLGQRGLVLDPASELAAIGLDSLRAMELVNTLNQDLNLSLEPSRVFAANTVGALVTTIEVALWITGSHPPSQGILL